MILVDTHAHINFKNFADDLDATIKRAYENQVKYILNIGVDIQSTNESVQLADKYDNVFASAGIHPTEAKGVDVIEAIFRIEQIVKHKKVVALGEVGLDYYHDDATPDEQQKLFRAFLELQKKCNLPLIMHVREAYDDLFSILNDVYPDGNVAGVVHCFSGDKEHLKQALDLGLFVSITGPVTYKKSDALREIAKLVPDERLLLETDCPYLAPQKYRGKRNEPAYIKDLCEYISELRGVSPDDLARITTLNCNNLFGFPEIDLSPKAVYKIRDSIYINTTKSCTNKCTFCVKFSSDIVKGHNLKIDKDPGVGEVLKEIKCVSGDSKKVVFCGLGESMLRFDFVKEVASQLKKDGFFIRIDTNGQGNIINKRNVLPELNGIVDSICISLNAQDEKTYNDVCKPEFSGNVFAAVIDFIKEAKKYIPNVIVTYVDVVDVDKVAMEQLVNDLGVQLRVRYLDVVG